MRPTKILHEFVQNLQVIEFEIEPAAICKIAPAKSCSILFFEIFSQNLNNLLAIGRTAFPFLFLLNNTTSDIPVRRQRDISDSSIRLPPPIIDYPPYITHKLL